MCVYIYICQYTRRRDVVADVVPDVLPHGVERRGLQLELHLDGPAALQGVLRQQLHHHDVVHRGGRAKIRILRNWKQENTNEIKQHK